MKQKEKAGTSRRTLLVGYLPSAVAIVEFFYTQREDAYKIVLTACTAAEKT